MKTKKKPETIDNRWDILYRDYSEIYDRFAQTEFRDGNIIKSINKIIKLKNKIILDIGSGSGLSTIALAKYAKFAYGVEPEKSMRKVAIKKAEENGIINIKFLEGRAEKMPLKAKSVDAVVGINGVPVYHTKTSKFEELARKFIKEATRVVKRNGYIIAITVAPGWYGGELAPIIVGKNRVTESEEKTDKLMRKLGFKHKDVYALCKFGSLKEAIETYGFIFGRKAINYLKNHKKTSIRWKFRLHYICL